MALGAVPRLVVVRIMEKLNHVFGRRIKKKDQSQNHVHTIIDIHNPLALARYYYSTGTNVGAYLSYVFSIHASSPKHRIRESRMRP
jgi:hypothetical protein